MERLIAKYAQKVVDAGLADPEGVLLGGIDAEVVWNRDDPLIDSLWDIASKLNINSIMYCRPCEPFASMVAYLAEKAAGAIYPRDTETRTFLHDLPVETALRPAAIVSRLKQRKGVVLRDGAVITVGNVSPEQAFIVFSSIVFSCYVKFLGDQLAQTRSGELESRPRQIIELARSSLPKLPLKKPMLKKGPFSTESEIHKAMIEAGRMTVRLQLVDSFFGNISYRALKTLYISQTGSSLDELEGCIDPCPLDGSRSTGLTASSELPAHLRIVGESSLNAVLHGHPKFPVILSLDCDVPDCAHEGRCHTHCPVERFVHRVPIVPGEVGAGPHGLVNTLPPAFKKSNGVIVFGHGVFTASETDFQGAFETLVNIEQMCRDEYFSRIGMR